MTKEQAAVMFGDIPYEKFLVHNWRTDVVKLGEVPAAYLEEVTGGLWHEPVSVEINRRVMDEKYDLIISPGQVVPHEVIGKMCIRDRACALPACGTTGPVRSAGRLTSRTLTSSEFSAGRVSASFTFPALSPP